MGEFEELDTDEPLEKKLERHAYDRLIMLADGVFAFAATLLALEVRVPPGWTGTLRTLITTSTISSVSSYVVSFTVVAIYWMGNRRIMATFRRVDGAATLLTLLVLMLVALLPTISRTLVTANGDVTESSILYVCYVTLIGMVQAILWFYGAFIAGLTDRSLDRGYKIRALVWMLVMPTAASGTAMLAMGFAPRPWGYIGVVAIVGGMIVLRARVMERGATKR